RFHIPSTTSNSSAIDEEAAPTGDELCAGPAVSPQDQFNLAINHVSNLSGIWFCSICDVTLLEGRLAALNHLDSVEHKKMRSGYQPRKPPNVPEYYYIERNDYSGSVHCRLCRKRLGSVDTWSSHERGRAHVSSLTGLRRRQLNAKCAREEGSRSLQ
ncbi:hypothetical protein FOZ62_010712, partial [Perkinsus olseni]